VLQVLNVFTFQILCLGEMIAFSHSCESAIRDGTVRKLRDALNKKLQSYTSVYINPQEIGEAGMFDQ